MGNDDQLFCLGLTMTNIGLNDSVAPLRSLILAPLSESKINHFNIKCHRIIRSMPILDTPVCLHNLTVIRIYRPRMTRKCGPRKKPVIITKYGFVRLWSSTFRYCHHILMSFSFQYISLSFLPRTRQSPGPFTRH